MNECFIEISSIHKTFIKNFFCAIIVPTTKIEDYDDLELYIVDQLHN